MLSGGVTSLSSSDCAVRALGAARNITHAAKRILVRAATDSLPELFTADRNALIFKNSVNAEAAGSYSDQGFRPGKWDQGRSRRRSRRKPGIGPQLNCAAR